MNHIQFGEVSCITKIKGIYSSLSPVEKELADYVLANQSKVISSTIQNLAKLSGVSYSTITRSCTHLGLNGFKELKDQLTTDMLTHTKEVIDIAAYEILDDRSTNTICEKTFSLFSSILEDCAQLLEFKF